MFHRRKALPSLKKQTGNLYIIAIFVIVVMGFLANALSRMEWSNSDALAKDVLGTRAWFAAHSANEWILTQIYPIGDSTNNDIVSVCAAINSEDNSDIDYASGMLSEFKGCSDITTTCDKKYNSDLAFYKIESAVTCGSGQLQVARKQEVWVRESLSD